MSKRPKTIAALLCLLLFGASTSSHANPPLVDRLCSLSRSEYEPATHEALALLKQDCATCTLETVQKFVQQFNPNFEGVRSAIELSQNASHLPAASTVTDLGTEEQWRQVQESSDELHRRAYGVNFGERICENATAHFRKGHDTLLTFIASRHEYVLNPQQIAAQRSHIEHEINTTHPQVLIAEGLPRQIPCPQAATYLLAPADTLKAEQEFAAQIFLRGGLRVMGGEPASSALSERDRRGMRIIQSFAGSIISDAMRTAATPEEKVQASQQNLPPPSWSLQEFQNWYIETNGTPFDPTDKDGAQATAYRDMTPSFYIQKQGHPSRGSNRLQDREETRRNQSATRLIRQELLQSRNIMVIYGSGHLPEQLPVFEAAFGRSAHPGIACSSSLSQPPAVLPCSPQQ